MDIPNLAAMAVVSIASVVDVRTRRVPNLLTAGSVGAALFYFSLSHGAAGLMKCTLGLGVGLALFLPLFMLRGMGAGDVKLLGAIGAWLGPSAVVRCALYAVLAGGVLTLCVAIRQRYLQQAFANLGTLLWSWRIDGPRPLPGLTLADSNGPRLPYATAIAAGTLIAIWLT